MSRTRDVEKLHHAHARRVKRARKRGASEYRNSRVSSQSMREKFGSKLPNSTKEALLLDMINGDIKWCEATQKELIALEKLSTWIFHPILDQMPNEF